MTTEGMAEYICECNVKGIGKKLSQDIVAKYGRKTFDVILNDCGGSFEKFAEWGLIRANTDL